MPQPEFAELIKGSIAYIGDVRRYTQGEQVFPIQDPKLEEDYLQDLTGYFQYCQKALTEPSMVALISRSRVGVSSYTSLGIPCVGLSSLLPVVRQISPEAYLKIDETPAWLVFSATTFMVEDDKVRHDLEKQQKQAEIREKYTSRDGFNDWVFGERQNLAMSNTMHLTKVSYLYGFRTMGPSDLLFPGVLHKFVEGVGNTFRGLSKEAEQEVAAKYDGITNIEIIKRIIEAFKQTNGILDNAFDSQTTATLAFSAKRARKIGKQK